MAQFLQNFADKLPHLAQRMLRGNAPFRVDIREHPALIEKSSTHRKSSRRISGKSESPPLHSGEVFPQTARDGTERRRSGNMSGIRICGWVLLVQLDSNSGDPWTPNSAAFSAS